MPRSSICVATVPRQRMAGLERGGGTEGGTGGNGVKYIDGVSLRDVCGPLGIGRPERSTLALATDEREVFESVRVRGSGVL